MVNENQGKKYEPTPVYNRKALRKAIKLQWATVNGVGANKNVGRVFKEVRNKMMDKMEESK